MLIVQLFCVGTHPRRPATAMFRESYGTGCMLYLYEEEHLNQTNPISTSEQEAKGVAKRKS